MEMVIITEERNNIQGTKYRVELIEDNEVWKEKSFYFESDYELKECDEDEDFKFVKIYEYSNKEDFKKSGWFDDLENFVEKYAF